MPNSASTAAMRPTVEMVGEQPVSVWCTLTLLIATR
jgi:hypothetical protein